MNGSAVTLGDADKGTATANNDDPTRIGMICQQGTLSDTLGLLSDALGFSTADSMVEVGVGLIDDETPKTGLKKEVVLVE